MQDPPVDSIFEPVFACRIRLQDIFGQHERLEKVIAKANICDVQLVQLDRDQCVVKFDSPCAVFPHHVSAEQLGRESESAEKPGETAVEFVAKPASMAVDNLLENGALVEDDWNASANVEILERNVLEVGPVKLDQRCVVGLTQRLQFESAEISIKLRCRCHGGGEYPISSRLLKLESFQ